MWALRSGKGEPRQTRQPGFLTEGGHNTRRDSKIQRTLRNIRCPFCPMTYTKLPWTASPRI